MNWSLAKCIWILWITWAFRSMVFTYNCFKLALYIFKGAKQRKMIVFYKAFGTLRIQSPLSKQGVRCQTSGGALCAGPWAQPVPRRMVALARLRRGMSAAGGDAQSMRALKGPPCSGKNNNNLKKISPRRTSCSSMCWWWAARAAWRRGGGLWPPMWWWVRCRHSGGTWGKSRVLTASASTGAAVGKGEK